MRIRSTSTSTSTNKTQADDRRLSHWSNGGRESGRRVAIVRLKPDLLGGKKAPFAADFDTFPTKNGGKSAMCSQLTKKSPIAVSWCAATVSTE